MAVSSLQSYRTAPKANDDDGHMRTNYTNMNYGVLGVKFREQVIFILSISTKMILILSHITPLYSDN